MSPDSADSITSESLLPKLSKSAGEGYEAFTLHVAGFRCFVIAEGAPLKIQHTSLRPALLFLQKMICLNACLLKNGAERAFWHIARMVGNVV